MAVDFATQLYLPNFDLWGRPVTFYPLASQPNVSSYNGRGIYDSTDAATDMFEAESVLSDAQIILDIYAPEFAIIPMKEDRIFIPPYMNVPGGSFIVWDVSPDNAGGEVTLTLRRVVEAKAPGYLFNVAPIYWLGAPDFATPTLTVT